METVGMFRGHLEYITAVWYVLGPFGNLVVSWDILTHFGKLYQEKSGNPDNDGAMYDLVSTPKMSNNKVKKRSNSSDPLRPELSKPGLS
jgi:hypothetical protein